MQRLDPPSSEKKRQAIHQGIHWELVNNGENDDYCLSLKDGQRLSGGLPGLSDCRRVCANAARVFSSIRTINLRKSIRHRNGLQRSRDPGAKVKCKTMPPRSPSNWSPTRLVTSLHPVAGWDLQRLGGGQWIREWQGTGIVLNASDVRTLTISLRVGAESKRSKSAPAPGRSTLWTPGRRLKPSPPEDLEKQPLIGRNATEILRIIPGSAQITLSGTNRPASDGQIIGINGFTVNGSAGGMAAVSINGQSGTGLSINQDGQNVEDPGAPGSATPVNPNPDMISEIQIMTSNYGADNAKGPVVINTLSKSGGSSFHGDFHFFARNSALNAEESNNKQQEVINGYTPGYLSIPNHYYYPGFTVGGPVIIPHTRFNSSSKTKFFFHEAFEKYDQLIDGGINDAFVPTANMIKTGDFSPLNNWGSPAWGGATQPDFTDAGRYGVTSVPQQPTDAGLLAERPGCTITNGTMNAACIDPNAQLWLQDSLPVANLAAPNLSGWNYVTPVQESQNSTQNMAKFDMNFSENTKAYISWSRQRESRHRAPRACGWDREIG